MSLVASSKAGAIVRYRARLYSPDLIACRPNVRVPALLGNALIFLFVVVLGAWASFVPLDGGAVAPGVIKANSGTKTIQHLEGGIISELPVSDGNVVRAGQPLVVLEDTQSRAAYEALQQQRLSLVARKARLDAEKADRNRITLPQELRSTDPQTKAIIEAQQEIFDARRSTVAARRDILNQRIEQLEEQIKGYQAQVQSTSRQIGLISEELQAKQYLLGRGLIPKPEALRLQRADAQISGQRGEYVAEIARAQQQIGEAKMQILSIEADRTDQIAAEEEKVRADLADVDKKLHASRDVLKRTVVTAPVNGTVVNVKFKTIGGVVGPGEPIMTVVPSGDELIVEAHLTPHDVKAVHADLPAKIRLSAYSSRVVPTIPGTVLTVSADRLIDDATHKPYYLARVSIDQGALRRLAPEIHLIAGMPVEVLVVTEKRTMLDYLTQPFRDALWRSFRET